MTGTTKSTVAPSDKRPPVIAAFQSIAAAVDEIGPANAPVFLAKLALLLSHELGDSDTIVSCVERAKTET